MTVGQMKKALEGLDDGDDITYMGTPIARVYLRLREYEDSSGGEIRMVVLNPEGIWEQPKYYYYLNENKVVVNHILLGK